MNPIRNWVLIALVFAFGISAFGWFTFAPTPEPELDEDGQATPSSLVRLLTWFAVLAVLAAAAMVFFVFWFALTNRDLNRVTDRWFSTPLWTALLFVPLVQFVGLYMMAQHIHKAQAATGSTGLHPVVLFILMWLLFPLGLVMAQLQIQKVDWGQESRPWWAHAQPAVDPPKWHVVQEDHGEKDAPPREWVKAEEEPLEFDDAPGPALRTRVRPEVAPMPASGVAAYFFSIASVPLALLGPAGLAAGLAGLYSRERFLDLETRMPGHRGGRATTWLLWPALVGIGVSFVVSSWMLAVIFFAT